jgi:HlyD family secretion protein
MTFRKSMMLLILIAAVAAGGYYVFRSKNVSANASEKDLITAQQVDFPLIVSATGILEATRTVSVGPPPLRLISQFKLVRMVPEGTPVSEGDFLMEFDTSNVASRLRDVTARFQREQENRQNKRSNSDLQLKNLKLSLEQAKTELQKLEVKMASQVDLVSGIEVEQTQIQRDAARKNVEFLEKKLQYMTESGQLDLRISRSNESNFRFMMDMFMDAVDSFTVRAPVSGVVIYKRSGWTNEAKEVGSNVGGNDSVMEIPDLSSIHARVRVDEVDSGKIGVGQDANISVDAVQGKTFSGKVTSIGSILTQLNPQRPQKTMDAYVDLNAADSKQLRPGMSLKAQIMVGQYPKVVVVPLSSIQEREGRSFVQVWQPASNSFEWREIQLRTNDGLTAVVESGLSVNEKIRAKPKA